MQKLSKRYVSLSVRYPMDGKTDKWQFYFSTDDSMDGREVLDYYRTWFHMEFYFRDGNNMQEPSIASQLTSGNWISTSMSRLLLPT